MIECRHMQKIQNRTGTSSFWIPASDHDFGNPCLHNSTRTHLTRFQCNVHYTVFEPPVTYHAAGFPYSLQFRMGQRIEICIPSIVSTGYDFSIPHNHASNGDFIQLPGFSGLPDRFLFDNAPLPLVQKSRIVRPP